MIRRTSAILARLSLGVAALAAALQPAVSRAAAFQFLVPQPPDPVLTGLNIPADAAVRGMWSATAAWPMVPIHVSILPDGRVLSFGAPAGGNSQDGRTLDVWDPLQPLAAGHRTFPNAQGVDSFCSTAAYLQNGSLLIAGGASGTTGFAPTSSAIFDPAQTSVANSNVSLASQRWYSSMITLADGRPMIAGGGNSYTVEGSFNNPNGSLNLVSMTPEVFENGRWRSLFNAMSRDAFGPDFNRAVYPRMWVAPNGLVFGVSSERMWYLDPNANGGTGATRTIGTFKEPVNQTTLPNIAQTSTAVMFDIGRVIQVGGNGYVNGQATTSSRAATVFDIRNGDPIITETAPMSFGRQLANSTVGANGFVFVNGGSTFANNAGINNASAIEFWNPATGQWTIGPAAANYRGYHSIAALLPNGTILTGGGGIPGPVTNLNVEVYYPPYLFARSGAGSVLATRPQIVSASAGKLAHGEVLNLEMNSAAPVSRVAVVALSNVTHAVNFSQRYLPVTFSQSGAIVSATMPPNGAIAPPGYYQVIVSDAAGVPSRGFVVAIGATMAPPPNLIVNQVTGPSVTSPGNQITTVGQTVSVQVAGSGGTGAITFSATGLPPGLGINPATGLITGTPTTSGVYSVNVVGTSGGQTATATFSWTVLLANLGSGSLLRETWTGIPLVAPTLANLTSLPTYPNTPASSGPIPLFETPTNVAEGYGQRVRGFVHAPVTGRYRFYIAADDLARLLLSTDATPANATIIARQDAWTTPRNWLATAPQASVEITLQAGQRYYIEALMVEGNGGDNLAVGWQLPGSTTIDVIPGAYLSPFQRVPPAITTIADQTGTLGLNVSLQVQGTAGSGGTLAYAATGLPTGLTINAATGLISGTPTTAGTSAVTITVTESGQTATARFNWTIQTALGSGTLLREVWTGLSPVNTTLTTLTTLPGYPNNPTSTGAITSFETPTDFAEYYGQRVRGFVTAPVSGRYRFYIAADDFARLLLSTDANPANATVIARQDTWTTPRNWFATAPQASVEITLQAGQRYYIEALMVETFGGDNLAVGWQLPGSGTIDVIPGAVLSPFQPTVTNPTGNPVRREVWTNIPGSEIVNLTSSPNYPNNPTTSELITTLEAPLNAFDNYGQRLRSWVVAPTTGQYRFYVAGDDTAQLSLSTDANPANARVIATCPSAVAPRAWTAFAAQQTSALITLQAGQRYYIEALMKDATGGDQLAVGWSLPGSTAINVIPTANLIFLGQTPPPTLATVATQRSSVGASVSLQLNATAGSAGTLSYTATGLPPGLTLNAQTGAITGSPTQTGTFSVTATVTEGAQTASASFSWTVTQPAIAAVAAQRSLVGTPVSLQLNATAGNAGTLTYGATGLPPGLTLNAQSGLISGSPTQVGTFNVTASVAEGGSPVTTGFAWTIAQPTIAAVSAQRSGIGAQVSLQLNATAGNGGTLTYGATGLPPGLTLNAQSGLITGTPTQAGTFNVTASVTESGPAVTTGFTWTITEALALSSFNLQPAVGGADASFNVTITGGIALTYSWNFGDGSPSTAFSSDPSATYRFAAPGIYLVSLTVRDADGRTFQRIFNQIVTAPVTDRKPTMSSALAYTTSPAGDRVWVVNPDADTVTVLNATTGATLAEIAVPAGPRCIAQSADGRLWVTSVDADGLTIIDPATLAVQQSFTGARGSRPFGIAFSPDGTTGWLVREGTGQLVRFNPADVSVTATIDVGANPRHVSVDAASAKVYVSRFITPALPGESTATVDTTGRGGEVVIVDAATATVTKTAILQHNEAADTEASARGIPNYLGAAAISPDGLAAWIPSKQDNIKRGTLRDGQALAHDKSVRAIASRLVLATGNEDFASRIDFDNAGVPSAIAYVPHGGIAFVALEAIRRVAIVDVAGDKEVGRLSVGLAPQALAVSPDGRRLYVQNFMDRTVSIIDVSTITSGAAFAGTPIATVSTVATEKLSAEVLRGKQLFYDAADPRLALEGYISCATCHNDGGHDGRTWDFTGFGEGLRNTPTLRGHGNTLPAHWTGNFDEIQDFENQIRNFAGGSGLIENGAANPPLGAPNAGRSADLDALAAYVNSLTTHGTSPAAPDTAEALAGRAVFLQQNCASCHSGSQLTNSALGVLADIGTIKASSGRRLGQPLTGFDTPTLRGLWGTAPYLHDGSAATLEGAIAAHRGVTVSETERRNLASFLRTLGDGVPAPVNSAPTITVPVAQSTARGADVNLTISAQDPDGEPLAFSATGLPTGLSIDASTGVISGKIAGNAVSSTNATVTVTDGITSTSVTFTWTITTGLIASFAENFNGAALDDTLWSPGSLYVPRTGVIDPAITVVQTGGKLVITPRTNVDGSNYNGILSNWSVDLRGSAVSAEVEPALPNSLTWFALGRGQDFALIAVTAGFIYMEQMVGGVSDFDGVPYDPVAHRYWRIRHDSGTDEIVFEAGPNPASWTVLRKVPRQIAIDTLQIEFVAGSYQAEANPGTASFDNLLYTPNRRPELVTPTPQIVRAGQAVSLAISASDADGQTVRYTASGLPAGLSIDVVSGVISGTVGVEAARNNEVTVSVSDGLLSRSGSFGWTVLPASTLGVEWTSQEIGGGAVAGGASFGGGVYTLRSAGLGVVLGGDQFQYVWQQWSGDGELVARVTSQTATDPAARAGLIFRESLSGTSRFGAVFLTPSRGYVHEFRQVSGGPTGFTLAARNAAPNNWLRLIRSGDTVTSFRSVDGVTWTQIASGRVVMSRGLTAGLIVSSKAAGQVSTATMDNVRFTPSTVPAPWVGGDIGAPARTELESFANGVFTVRGGGAGITGTADHGHFTSQVLSGNGQITARVVSQSNTFTWAKAGVMIRESVASNARMALATVTQGQGVFFQARTSVGGAATAVAAPRGNTWVRLVRNGNTITAWRSGDGVTWTALGTTQIAFGPTVSFGLAVTASGANLLSTAVFDNVTVTPLP